MAYTAFAGGDYLLASKLFEKLLGKALIDKHWKMAAKSFAKNHLTNVTWPSKEISKNELWDVSGILKDRLNQRGAQVEVLLPKI